MKQNSKVQESNGSDFLPSGYDVPSSNDNYFKFEPGENKFRILSKPIIGWLDWENKKPLRFPMNEKPAKQVSPDQAIKHFWAFIVWDYSSGKIKILEVTQKSIQAALENYIKNPDWGSPYAYDITVSKKGSGMDTEYLTVASPPKKVASEVIEAFNERHINLLQLFSGDDPFTQTDYHTPLEVTL